MQLDWITVLAQIANFLVLVWLLRRFLYGPITRAMAQREQRIADRLAAAREARETAEGEAEKLAAERRALDDSREEVLGKARAEADALRERLEQDLRDEIAERRRAWKESLDQERAEAARAIELRAGREVIGILRDILADFADTDLSAQVAEEFVRRLETLDPEQRARLAEAARDSGAPALVECGLELPSAVHGRITRAIHETLAPGIAVDYRTSGDILLGIRLTLDGQTVEWSAGRYLARLEAALSEALEASALPARVGRA